MCPARPASGAPRGVMTPMQNGAVAVYFDYLCPYAWRGAEVVELVADELGLRFDWRHFSLYQANHRGEPWHVWNQRLDEGDETGSKGLLPFLASIAARKQGREPFDRFRLALLRARHRDRAPLTRSLMFAAAETARLHLACFEADLDDPEARTTLAHEHCRAAREDVFGTPTFAFPNGHAAYFRIRELPVDRAEATALFRNFHEMLTRYPYLETVRRPRARLD